MSNTKWWICPCAGSWLSLVLAALMAVIISGIATAQSGGSGWKPDGNVEIVVPSGPGGGLDRTARSIQKVLLDRRMVDATISVVNKPGGGSTIGWAYLNQHAGDARYISISASNLLTNQFVVNSSIKYTDVTLIAVLFTEYNVFTVAENSPIKSGKDFVTRIKQDPTSLSIGIANARGNHSHISAGLVGKSSGVDVKRLKIVIFGSGGELMTALLGGHIDLAVATGGNVLPHIQAGRMRAIGIAAPQRLAGAFSAIPTWKEQGINATFSNWRIAIGPKGLSRQQTAYWDEVFGSLVKTEEFRKYVETSQAEPSYLNSSETAKYLDGQYNDVKGIMVDLGLVK